MYRNGNFLLECPFSVKFSLISREISIEKHACLMHQIRWNYHFLGIHHFGMSCRAGFLVSKMHKDKAIWWVVDEIWCRKVNEIWTFSEIKKKFYAFLTLVFVCIPQFWWPSGVLDLKDSQSTRRAVIARKKWKSSLSNVDLAGTNCRIKLLNFWFCFNFLK